MIHPPRTGPRREHLQQQALRVQASPSLAERFPSLMSLTVDLGHYDAERRLRSSQIKFTANLAQARSVFRIGCHNPECVGGDFDLSDVLVQAVLARKTSVSGEACCQGWRSRATIDTVSCGNILRYSLTLGF